MASLPNTFSTHRRKILISAGLVLVYACLGFLLLPWFAERQLVSTLNSRLGLNTQVESIYFNPFSFYMEIKGLSIADSEQTDILNLSHTHLNFQASRLVLLKLQISEFVANGLELNIVRHANGSDTVTDLSNRWFDSAATPAEDAVSTSAEDAQSSLAPMELLIGSLSNIQIQLRDEVPETAFETVVEIPSLQVTNISTLDNQTGNYSASVTFESDATLSINGDLSVVPISTAGQVQLEAFPISMLARYAQDILPFGIPSGDVSAGLNYRFEMLAEGQEISVEAINLQLENLSSIENGEDTAFLDLRAINLTNGALSIPANTFSIDGVSVAGVSVSADIDERKELNFLRMLSALTPTTGSNAPADEATPETAAGQPWLITLSEFTLSDTAVEFADNSLELPFSTVANIGAQLTDISSTENSVMPFSLDVAVDSGGSFGAIGEVQALPALDLNANINLNEFGLSAFQPYINEFASVDLQQGAVAFNAEVATNSSEPFSLRGGFSVNNLSLSDATLNETLISFEELGIDVMDISLAENRLDISELSLNSLFSRVVINEDGSTNLGRSIKVTEPADPDLAAASPEDVIVDNNANNDSANLPIAITLGRVAINNASANFTDRNLPIVFNANIKQLNGSAEGFASNSSQPTAINLEGQVDEYGLVQIVSSLNPFSFTENSDIKVDFTNIDMPAMTPYVVKFAGREIREGAIDLGLSYVLTNGNLEANNQMILKGLELGERVEQPDAMSLPLDLALALLKDGNGVIDLEVPITGDVNDPEFNFSPAIRRAITNILTNVVAAPFRLLGNLIGGSDTSLESIRFLPGRSDIAAPEQQILEQLKEALIQRPQLALDIPAVSAAEDRLALQTLQFEMDFEAALAASQNSDELLTQRSRQALESLYTAAANGQSLESIEAVHTTGLEVVTDPSTQTAIQFDLIAYNADLRSRLIDGTNVSAAAMESLAQARAEAVVNFLIEDGSLTRNRARILDQVQSALDEDGWMTMEFDLEAVNN